MVLCGLRTHTHTLTHDTQSTPQDDDKEQQKQNDNGRELGWGIKESRQMPAKNQNKMDRLSRKSTPSVKGVVADQLPASMWGEREGLGFRKKGRERERERE